MNDLRKHIVGKVYLASASVNRDAVRALAASLLADGVEVVSTWHDQAPFDSKNDHALPATSQMAIAAQCLLEVEACDTLVMLAHKDGRGSLVEYGYAIGVGRRVVWVTGGVSTCFASLAAARVDPNAGLCNAPISGGRFGSCRRPEGHDGDCDNRPEARRGS